LITTTRAESVKYRHVISVHTASRCKEKTKLHSGEQGRWAHGYAHRTKLAPLFSPNFQPPGAGFYFFSQWCRCKSFILSKVLGPFVTSTCTIGATF